MHHIANAPSTQPRITILRRDAVLAEAGYCRSALYAKMLDGLFPRPVKLAGHARAVGWPSNEVEAVVAATIAGVSEDEMRQLVADLVAGRKAAH